MKSDSDDERDEARGGGEAKPVRPRRRRPAEEGKDGGGARAEGESKDGNPTIMKGGWGMGGGSSGDNAGPGATSTSAARPPDELPEGRRGRRKNHHHDDDDSDLIIIPDLEDEGEEDITLQVAVAPKNVKRRVPSLSELDRDIKHTVPSAAEGLDMSILTKTLVPPEMLREEDDQWEFEGLLQSVTQEYNALSLEGKAGAGAGREGGEVAPNSTVTATTATANGGSAAEGDAAPTVGGRRESSWRT